MALIPRDVCEAAFRDAVFACDPAKLVRCALERQGVPRPIVALAVGKSAMGMARGVGVVARGLCISDVDDGRGLPPRWRLVLGSHPLPDEQSVAAGMAALALVESACEPDSVLALISGGASALMEVPAHGVSLETVRERTQALMASGAPIHELNAMRTELSALKGGKLADRAMVSVTSFVISDVVGDDPRVVGSGPTVRDGERVDVLATQESFGAEIVAALRVRGFHAGRDASPMTGDVVPLAARLADGPAPFVAWGEPTIRLPDSPGAGGRATHLALLLARHLRGSSRSAFVAASDGRDATTGAAGAYVDGATWNLIVAAGIDPDAALSRADSSTALAAVGALFTPGPTGVNHADVVVIG